MNNLQKKSTFLENMEMIQKDLKNKSEFADKIKEFEKIFGVFPLIEKKQKKILKNMDFLYLELKKKLSRIFYISKKQNF